MASNNNQVEVSLQQRWKDLTTGIDEDVQTEWWEIIKSKYSDSTRKYHTLLHLYQMFDHMDSHTNNIEIPNAMSYAIFFHDLEYDAQTQNNEEESIKQFQVFCKDSGIDQNKELTNRISELILMTKSHCTEEHTSEGVHGSDDIHYFLDFDVSILGSSPSEYKEYASQIREEYKYLPPAKYNFLRTKVLKLFLQIPNIFATKPFRDTYEQQARTNIQEEISELNNDSGNN